MNGSLRERHMTMKWSEPTRTRSVKTRRRSWLELWGVVGTGILHLFLKHIGANGLFIGLASVCWTAYLVGQVRRDWQLWKEWGFRLDNLRASFWWPSIFFGCSSILMAAYGIANERVVWQGHILFLLVLYPLWGILQQFLVQVMGVTNVLRLFPRYGLRLAMPAGVVLFSIVHFPHIWLMMATGLLACLCIPCYIRDRNLWPLGLYHGWLGTFFYLWVLGRDPWVAVFGE